MEGSDVNRDREIPGTPTYELLATNTYPSMVMGARLDHLASVIDGLETRFGPLHFRMGFVATAPVSHQAESDYEKPATYDFVTMITYRGKNYIVPRVHSGHRHLITDETLDENVRLYLVRHGMKMLFSLEEAGRFLPVSEVVMSIPTLKEDGLTHRAFMRIDTHACDVFAHPEKDGNSLYVFSERWGVHTVLPDHPDNNPFCWHSAGLAEPSGEYRIVPYERSEAERRECSIVNDSDFMEIAMTIDAAMERNLQHAKDHAPLPRGRASQGIWQGYLRDHPQFTEDHALDWYRGRLEYRELWPVEIFRAMM